MSRVGKQPIAIPDGVQVTFANGVLTVTGPKGTLSQDVHNCVLVEVADGQAQVSVKNPDNKEDRAHWGLARSLLANMVGGVTEGFKKSLEIQGVGYKFEIQGKKLVMSVGYSHKVEKDLPDDVMVELDSENPAILHVTGTDKQRVGEVAAQIRLTKKPEPYKGKGIRYVDEYVRRKAGKTGAAA